MTVDSIGNWNGVADAILGAAATERMSSFFVELGNYQHLPSESLDALASGINGGRVVYADELQKNENRPYRWRLPGRTTLVVVTPEWDSTDIFNFPWLSSEDREEASERVGYWVRAAQLSDELPGDSGSSRTVIARDFGDDWDAPWLARLRQILAFPSLEATVGEATEEFLRILDENVESGDSKVVFIAVGRRHQKLPDYGLHATIRKNAKESGRAFAVDERQWQGLVRENDENGLIVFP